MLFEFELIVTFNEIRDLKNSQSSNFNVRIFKSMRETIVYPLTKLLNHCVNEGFFPDCLSIKKALWMMYCW